VCSHHDDQRLAALRPVALDEFDPRHAWHTDVAEHDVRLQLQRPREPVLAVARRVHRVAFLAEDQGYGLPEPGLVIDDENIHATPAFDSASTPTAAGRTMVNTAPPCSPFSTRIVP